MQKQLEVLLAGADVLRRRVESVEAKQAVTVNAADAGAGDADEAVAAAEQVAHALLGAQAVGTLSTPEKEAQQKTVTAVEASPPSVEASSPQETTDSPVEASTPQENSGASVKTGSSVTEAPPSESSVPVVSVCADEAAGVAAVQQVPSADRLKPPPVVQQVAATDPPKPAAAVQQVPAADPPKSPAAVQQVPSADPAKTPAPHVKEALRRTVDAAGTIPVVMQWEIEIDRRIGCRVGVDVDEMIDGQLLVKSITEGDAMEMWNRKHPSKALKAGDRIVGVNGKSENLIDECRKVLLLTLSVVRQT